MFSTHITIIFCNVFLFLGEFCGQTKEIVKKAFTKAKGGVIFIDEAYELGKGKFAIEALTSLVEYMTKDEYKHTSVIIAGYHEDIEEMLKKNEGLKSR